MVEKTTPFVIVDDQYGALPVRAGHDCVIDSVQEVLADADVR